MSSDVLYLVVRLGADRYAIEAAQVVEVIPLVRLKALPGAPHGVAGVMNYRGEPIPVIDLELVATRSSTKPMNGARIVIVDLAALGSRRGNVGLLVPQATETLRIDPGAFASSGVRADGAPYLGPVLATDTGVIQRVSVSALLTPELLAALHPAVGAA
ncbi:chemotaxis protein CheW [soil metagenome]